MRAGCAFLGGSTNHWGGWCRPMDAIDFEAKRDWMPHSGWPFGRAALEPYYARAQALVEAGPWIYDQKGDAMAGAAGPVLPLGAWRALHQLVPVLQDARQRSADPVRPALWRRFAGGQKRHALLHANVTGIRLAANGASVDHLDIATSEAGKHFTVKPRMTVLAAGAMENARLMLASNDVMSAGVGNQNDLVGRFFADNPIPRDVATLVSFAGPLAAFYGSNQTLDDGAIMRATFAPTDGLPPQGASRRLAQHGRTIRWSWMKPARPP